jgi:Tfp pilus assembly protein PilF
VGDSIGGLLIFKKCARIDPTHPLPFVNSARTFTQMGQFDLAIAHIARALELDVSYCMTYVDLAQVHLQRGHTREALVLIEKALVLARHVSEIRDVLTSQRIAATQLELEGRGLYRQPLLEQQDTSVHI